MCIDAHTPGARERATFNINLFYFYASRVADAPLHRMIFRPEIDAAMA